MCDKNPCDCGKQIEHLARMMKNPDMSTEDKAAINWAMGTVFRKIHEKSGESTQILSMSLTLARLDNKIGMIPLLKDDIDLEDYITPLLILIRKELGEDVDELSDER